MKYKVGDKVRVRENLPLYMKVFDFWKVVGFEKCKSLRMVDIDLPMVKWSDDKPWLIENLKKLEVVDSYE